jgi:hypothetical protein
MGEGKLQAASQVSQQAPARYLVEFNPFIREQATRAQVDTLLQAAGLMLTGLASLRAIDGGFADEEQRLKGEARVAAELTFINACDRLDKIFQDDSRWSLDFPTQLEKLFATRCEQQSALNEAQRKYVEASQLPQNIFRPKLCRLPDGSWVAFIGDMWKDPNNALAGVGENPAAALNAFDAMFQGSIPEGVKQWLAEREKNELSRLEQMDPAGNGTTGGNEKSREVPPGNGGHPGPDAGSSGPQAGRSPEDPGDRPGDEPACPA